MAGALLAKLDVLIISTGNSGVMRVAGDTVERVAALGMEVKVERTARAVELYNGYNDREESKLTIAALQITC